MNGSKECKHCRKFFLDLHRRCTINLNGECDCPICQGVCGCTVAARESMPRMSDIEETVFGDSQVKPPTRKFGDPR